MTMRSFIALILTAVYMALLVAFVFAQAKANAIRDARIRCVSGCSLSYDVVGEGEEYDACVKGCDIYDGEAG